MRSTRPTLSLKGPYRFAEVGKDYCPAVVAANGMVICEVYSGVEDAKKIVKMLNQERPQWFKRLKSGLSFKRKSSA